MSALLDLSPGAVFANEFKVVRPLARGGMGAVYVVEQMGTARERALKLMHPQIAADEKGIERFEREARVASKIDSDHVVEVIAAGVDAKTSTPWLCMELLRGETLADRCEKQGRPSRADTIEAMKQLGHALIAAHRAGIVHRDLKPENVFLATPRREGVPFTLKVLDFGVAALVADSAGAKTTQGVGSPMWMAPEQTNVGRVTTATDVWALGLIAFYLLTGKSYWRAPTIEGSSLTALLVEMMVEPMPPASVRAQQLLVGGLLPDGFDAWFARATDRDPGQRFPDAGAAMPGLIALLEGRPGASPFEATAVSSGIPATRSAATLAAAAPAPAPTAAAAPVPAAMAPPVSSSRAWIWGVAALGVLGLTAIGVAATMGGGSRPDPAATTTSATALPVAAPEMRPITTEAPAPPAADPSSVLPAVEDEGRHDDETDDETESDDDSDDATEANVETDDEDETDDDESDDEETESEPAPRIARPRGARRPSASPGAAEARRMLLDRCWRATFEGETPPTPARWTFDFELNGSGHASNVRITGPSGGPFTSFRACVVSSVGQYAPSDGTTHVALTLP